MYVQLCMYVCMYILESSTEDNLEIWNESYPESENETETPDMPQFLHTDAEKQRSMILSKWLMRFLLILQTKFHLPDKSMDYLLKFLYAFFNLV